MKIIERLRDRSRYKNPSSKDVGMWPLTSHPTKRELLRLPERPWQEAPSRYSSLYLAPTNLQHDSGYTLIAIVGLLAIERVPEFPQWVALAEIAAYCDDICWTFPSKHPYDYIRTDRHHMMLRTDCIWPAGIMHVWASGEHYFRGYFEVGPSLSSTDVTLVIGAREGHEEKFRERMKSL